MANLSGGGLVTNSGSGSVTLTLAMPQNNSTTWSGTIQDGAGLTNVYLSGSGTAAEEYFSGVNTYHGTTGCGPLTIIVQSTSAAGWSTLVTSGSANTYYSDFQFDKSVFLETGTAAFVIGGLSGTGNLSLRDNGGNPVSLSVGSNNSNTIYAASLHDYGSGGSLVKIGTGTLTLTNSNTYTGATTISGGTLQLGDATAGHDPSLTTSRLTNNAAVVYDVSIAQTAAYAIGGSGNLIKAGPGTLTVSGVNTFGGGDSNGDIFGIVSIHQGAIQVGPRGADEQHQ